MTHLYITCCITLVSYTMGYPIDPPHVCVFIYVAYDPIGQGLHPVSGPNSFHPLSSGLGDAETRGIVRVAV